MWANATFIGTRVGDIGRPSGGEGKGKETISRKATSATLSSSGLEDVVHTKQLVKQFHHDLKRLQLHSAATLSSSLSYAGIARATIGRVRKIDKWTTGDHGERRR